MTGAAQTSLHDLLDMTGHVAVVTGGAGGIGLAIARRLGEAGARVVVADIADTDAAVSELRAGGYDASGAILDVTVESDHIQLVERVIEESGRLDVWVNCAGIFPSDLALDLDAAQWHTVLDVNVTGSFFGARAAARVMTARGRGVIVNICSTSGFRVSADGVSHYATSKAAVRGLTQALAREFGPSGVRVLGVAPVFTRTEQALRQLGGSSDDASAAAEQIALDRYATRIPLRRIAEPDDIARVVLFAASELAGFVTGTVIPADGGFLAV